MKCWENIMRTHFLNVSHLTTLPRKTMEYRKEYHTLFSNVLFYKRVKNIECPTAPVQCCFMGFQLAQLYFHNVATLKTLKLVRRGRGGDNISFDTLNEP